MARVQEIFQDSHLWLKGHGCSHERGGDIIVLVLVRGIVAIGQRPVFKRH